MALCKLLSVKVGFKKILQYFSEIIKQDNTISFDTLVWSKYLGGQGTETGRMKGMCRIAARTERHLVICCTLMLACATGLKLASEVVFHIPTGFYIKALIVLLILYRSKYSVINFLCTTGVLTDFPSLLRLWIWTHVYLLLASDHRGSRCPAQLWSYFSGQLFYEGPLHHLGWGWWYIPPDLSS